MANRGSDDAAGTGAVGGSLAGNLDETSFFRTVTERTPEGLFVVDDSDTIVYANPAMEGVLGYTPAELAGRSLRSIAPEEFPRHRTLLELLRQEGSELDVEPLEITLRHADGRNRRTTISFTSHRYEGEEFVTGTVRAVPERTEPTAGLERYERIIETIDDGIYVLDGNFTITNVNAAVTELTGYTREELVGSHASLLTSDTLLEAAAETSMELLESREEAATLRGEIETKGGDRVPIETRFSLYSFDDERYGQVGVVRDITERKQFEETLTALHDSTRELQRADTESSVCQLIVDTATDVIDLSAAGIYLFDADRNLLCPTAASGEMIDDTASLDAVGPGTNEVWHAFVEGERVVGDEGPAGQRDAGDRVAYVPLSDHGVFVTAATDQNGLTDDRWTLIGLLAASAEVALSRIGRESELRAREEERKQQNQQLQRLSRVNAIIRGIDQALVQADTVEEITNAVCERLVAADRFSFAWIGEFDPASESDTLDVRAWAGEERGYLDNVSLSVESDEPAVRTAVSQERTVVSNVSSDFRSADWRKEALSRDFRTVLSVPLLHGDLLYGVLTVYVDRPALFGETTQAVFSELGETIANAMNAVETRRTLLTDDRIELKFRLRDVEDDLRRLATAAGCRLSYDEFIPHDGDAIRTFFTAERNGLEDVTAIEEQLLTVESLRVVEEREDTCLFEAVITDRTIASRLLDLGADVRSIRADDDGLELVVELPHNTDVRGFVETVRSQYPGAELVARHDREQSIQSSADVWTRLEAELTDRQSETLQIAYHSGFYEWPRETTGEEVAAAIGVSQPTVSRHLRACERKLLGMFLGPR